MAQSIDVNDGELQFSWGKKGGIGGARKEYQFYRSFTMDNVAYSLYDCVYLYKVGEPEPYIGKIIKLREWEHPKSKQKSKKAGILWFFRASEIKNYLGDYLPSKKEIFLACGEGCGLCNYNPLEAIAGKCSVICTSKDDRNPQPSEEDLEMADYIFSCTFDVQNLTISQKINDQIAGVEAKLLFNCIEELKLNPTCKLKDNGLSQNGEAGESDAVHPGPKTDSLEDLLKLDDNLKSVQTSSASLDQLKDSIRIQNANVFHQVIKSRIEDSFKESDCRKVKSKEEIPVEANHTESTNSKTKFDVTEEGPCKKLRLAADPAGLLVGTQDESDSRRQMTKSMKNDSLDQLKDKNMNSSRVSHTSFASEDDEMHGQKMMNVTNKPDSDRSRWFKELPWIKRLQKADEQGTLVLIGNLNPSYTSSEIVGIIKDTLHQDCVAKVIPQASFQNPFYGQAYAIFRTKDAANLVVSRINQGCLLQPNGSPLLCSKGMLRVPEQDVRGHLSIGKIKTQKEEMKNVVSTSHCSQANTIEFELAMEWIVVHEKSKLCMSCLHKEQVKEQNQFKKKLKLQQSIC